MQTAKQISVQLVNKPGRLSKILTALNKEKVGIRAYCVMDTGSRGTLRLVPDEPAAATAALEQINVSWDAADVLLVEVSSQSGGLPKICQRLADEHLNVDYCYGTLSPVNAKGGNLAVIKVNNLNRAQKILGDSPAAAASKPKKRPGRRPAYAR